jgi:hypothetical protein
LVCVNADALAHMIVDNACPSLKSPSSLKEAHMGKGAGGSKLGAGGSLSATSVR